MAKRDLNIVIGVLLDRRIGGQLKTLEQQLLSFSNRITTLGRDIALGVGVPLAALGQQSLSAAVEFDRLEKALLSVTGSADEAAVQLARIRALAELPGISFEQAVKTTLQLQGLGFTAEKAEETIRQVGNAIAASGGTQQNFEGVIRQLAQIEGKNKVLQEDIRILIENAPILGKILKDTFGGATAEAIREAGVNGEQFVDTLLASLAELPRVQGGLANSFENLGIAAKFALASIGQEVDRVFGVKELFDDLGAALNRAADVFKNLDDETKRTLIRFALFTAALGPALIGVGRLVNGFGSLISITRNVSEGIAGLGLKLIGFNKVSELTKAQVTALNRTLNASVWFAIAAGVFFLVQKFLELRKATQASAQELDYAKSAAGAFADVQRQANASIAESVGVVESLVSIAQDETRAQDERVAAIRRLKDEYPDYFGNVSEDLSQTDRLTSAKERLAAALLVEARARAATNKITELATEQAKIDEETAKSQERQVQIRERLAALGATDIGQARELVRLAEQRAQSASLGAGAFGSASLTSIGPTTSRIQALVEEFDNLEKTIQANEFNAASLGDTMGALAREAANAKVELEGVGKAATGREVRGGASPQQTEALRKIATVYGNAIKEIKALDSVTAELGGIIDDNVSKKSKIATKALIDLAELGVSASSKEFQNLVTILKETRRTIEPLEGIGTLDLVPSQLVSESTFKQAADLRDVFKEVAENATAFRSEVEKEINAEQLEIFKGQVDGLKRIIDPLNLGVTNFIETLADPEADTTAFQAFLDGIKKGLVSLTAQIVSTIVAASVLTAILSAIGLTGGTKALGLISNIKGEGSLFGGLFRLLGGQLFAEGGVVLGPTLGIVGESGPEAIIPLDKLNNFQSSPVIIGGEITMRGTDLVVLLERADRQRRRSRGI